MENIPVVSIIICTRDRAEHLQPTLQAIAQVRVPADLPAELIVADNASTDGTAELVQNFALPNMELRYLHEPKPGQCQARNAGIAAARGEIILFTDDDIRPSMDWIEGMCRPIVSGECDGVAGGITLAPALERPWIEPLHRSWLASTRHWQTGPPERLIGANMSFARCVLEKVPRFDTELGPGALGFGDDSLFSRQLLIAGFRLQAALEVRVEHHFDASRLTRAHLLKAAWQRGQVSAYTKHHWEHLTLERPLYRLARAVLRLRWWRFRKRAQLRQLPEGAPAWELAQLWEVSLYRSYLRERKKPRKYRKHGLAKL